MSDPTLDTLRARLAAMNDEAGDDAGWAAHAAVLDRLAALRRRADAAGWTSLALERDGAHGSIRLFGVPPGETLRAEIPDTDDAGDA